MKTVFLRVLKADDKASALLASIHNAVERESERFEVDSNNFRAIPRSPFAYWAGDSAIDCFRLLPSLEGNGRHAAAGAQTRDNLRFVRTSWEVSPTSISAPGGTAKLREAFIPLAKGGSHGRFYADIHLLVQWAYEGRELKAATGAWRASKGWGDYWRAAINSIDYYGRPGITWPVRSQKGFSARSLGSGAIFGHKGPTVFVTDDSASRLGATLALMNSRAFGSLVSLQMAFGAYEVGVIQHTPLPQLSATDEQLLAALSSQAWRLHRLLDSRTETSHAFALPAILQVKGSDFASRVRGWASRVESTERELRAIQAELDERSFNLYGLDDTSHRGVAEATETASDSLFDVEDDEDDDFDEENHSAADAATLAAELVSWAVGVAFGRFDVLLATGTRPSPVEPEPFDPTPAYSPAMLTGDDAMPLTRSSSDLPSLYPDSGLFVDDAGHAQDLTAATHSVLRTVFDAEADSWWLDIAALLDSKNQDLRSWLTTRFFEHHLKLYSRSRRKAPIIWQLAVPSGGYSIWLYAHRLTRDSLFQIQNDVVTPKLAHEERLLTDLIQGAGANPSAKERKSIAVQEAFIEELRSLLDEVKRVAPLWNPVLDDGVVLVMAPLWRLVPHHKAWQNELKSKWGELGAGKYDWSHTAMHLWPERVIPKCATDRSLAIAHGLEDVFWAEVENGKWKPRATPKYPVDELVRERTSVAAKAALKGLTEASAPNGPRARTRRLSP
jgi:hypothetical protein